MWDTSTLTSHRSISTMNNVQLPLLIDTLEKMNAYARGEEENLQDPRISLHS